MDLVQSAERVEVQAVEIMLTEEGAVTDGETLEGLCERALEGRGVGLPQVGELRIGVGRHLAERALGDVAVCLLLVLEREPDRDRAQPASEVAAAQVVAEERGAVVAA